MTSSAHLTPSSRGAVYRDLLAQFRAADIPSAELDARLLMAAATQVDDVALIADPDQTVPTDALVMLDGFIERRLAGEPVSRILGTREFWGMPFQLGTETLDPRPDSETLVEAVLHHVSDKSASLTLLDLGTGTGCLLLALLSELPNAHGVGVDRSSGAIDIARENAAHLDLAGRADFRTGNWGEGLDGPFDVVISNPPYIPTADIASLSPEVRRHDPMAALDGGRDGLVAYRAVSEETLRLLTPDGAAFWELGVGQLEDVSAITSGVGLEVCGVYPDLAGVPRVLKVKQSI